MGRAHPVMFFKNPVKRDSKKRATPSTVTVDRLNHSVVFVRGLQAVNSQRHPRKKFFNRKTPRGIKIVKTMINFLAYEKPETHKLLFVTVTTCQHNTRPVPDDRIIYANFGQWLKDRKIHYVCTVERQKDTEDLHFHCVFSVRSDFNFDFKHEELYLGRLFGVPPHPALIDVEPITDARGLAIYINKYVSKKPGKYSSIFTCRTFSISKGLRKLFKERAHNYVLRIADNKTIEFINAVRAVEPLEIATDSTGRQKRTDFFVCYNFSPHIWACAQRVRSMPELIIDPLKNQ